MADKDKNAKHQQLIGPTGLSGKSITDVQYWQEGSTHIIEISYTGGPYYLKFHKLQAEYGGTSDWGSGTRFN